MLRPEIQVQYSRSAEDCKLDVLSREASTLFRLGEKGNTGVWGKGPNSADQKRPVQLAITAFSLFLDSAKNLGYYL